MGGVSEVDVKRAMKSFYDSENEHFQFPNWLGDYEKRLSTMNRNKTDPKLQEIVDIVSMSMMLFRTENEQIVNHVRTMIEHYPVIRKRDIGSLLGHPDPRQALFDEYRTMANGLKEFKTNVLRCHERYIGLVYPNINQLKIAIEAMTRFIEGRPTRFGIAEKAKEFYENVVIPLDIKTEHVQHVFNCISIRILPYEKIRSNGHKNIQLMINRYQVKNH